MKLYLCKICIIIYMAYKKTVHTKPALNRAMRYITTLIEQSDSPGQTLPSIQQLSVQCGVSIPTMHAALREVAKAGILTIVKGGGCVITGSTTEHPSVIRL